MKKKLLILASIAPLFALGQATPATTYVGEGATVKVKSKTLYFNKGEFKVATIADQSKQGKVSNEGNVNVQGAFTGDDNGVGFVNEFTNGTSYGQLIIKNGEAVAGKMTGEYKFAPTSVFNYHNVAFPYVEYKASDAASNAGITSADWQPENAPVSLRYKSPLFVWNNEIYVNDNPQKMDVLVPTSAYSVNQYTYTSGVADALHSFVGKPNNNSNVVNFSDYSLSGKKNTDLNKYGEYYGSYIEDVTRNKPDNWTNFNQDVTLTGDNAAYGSNLFMLGNPYTSNIDLSELINANTNVDAIVLEKSASYFRANGTDANEIKQKVLGFFNGSKFKGSIGDVNYKIVRPYQIFTLRTKEDQGLSFTFNDDYKTFDIPNGLEGISLTTSAKGGDSFLSANEVYQVGMDLLVNGNETGNRFYLVASDFYQSEGNSEYEAYNDWLGNNVGFYSLQEKEDGTISEKLSDQPVYINGVNANEYVAKPIHLVFQGKDNTTYTLKARLNEALLTSGNKFYFEDKKEGEIREVTRDFEYTFVENELSKDRFVVYWNGLPETMSTSNVGVSQTVVYKSGNDYGVKFSQDLERADVYVYDLSGQLISVKKSIDTSSDYILPYLLKSNVYIVKVVGDNGEVTTKKIIK